VSPSLQRTNYGGGHRYALDGQPVPGVTTLIRDGLPKPALINWAARETAKYAVNHWDELAEAEVADRLITLEKARHLTRKSAGDRGTAVHHHVHRLALGETVEPAPELEDYVDAYLAFERDWRPEDLVVEAVIANRSAWYAGTLDSISKLIDGLTWLLDYKTSQSGIFESDALQLAAYARAEFYLGPDGTELPLPKIDRVGAVWLQERSYELIPIDAGEETFRAFRYVAEVAHFMDRRREVVGEALEPPARKLPEEATA
jgi:hypothetical protein